jgi:hypothetical protein
MSERKMGAGELLSRELLGGFGRCQPPESGYEI